MCSCEPARTTPSLTQPSPPEPHEAVRRGRLSTSMRLRGIHAHIGSQVFRAEPYAEAMDVIATVAGPSQFDEVSIGGSLGVPYVEGEVFPTITQRA